MPLAFVYIRIWYALQYIRFYFFQFAAVWLMIERNQLSKIGISAAQIEKNEEMNFKIPLQWLVDLNIFWISRKLLITKFLNGIKWRYQFSRFCWKSHLKKNVDLLRFNCYKILIAVHMLRKM